MKIILVGPPGAGKSRMIAWLKAHLHPADVAKIDFYSSISPVDTSGPGFELE